MKYISVRIPGQDIEIPYLEYKGTGSDKMCVISGGMHGDEVNGISLVENLLNTAMKMA